MTATIHRLFFNHVRLILSSLLIISIAVGVIVFIIHTQPSHAFAASLKQTCVQNPTMENCNNQDPESQGCAADAKTITQTDIKKNGFTIGRVERRYSHACQSWWGRVFDTHIGPQASMYITINGITLSAAPTFVSSQYRILYSPMVFKSASIQQASAITGTLDMDGISKAPDATLPAITISGN